MRSIIVDDEKNARLALRGILEEGFPEIEVIDECIDVPSAVKSINKNKPDLVFLDISMPGYSGLELLKFFDDDSISFKVIFVTAHSEYAINAFELSAVDYILKPIQFQKLQKAIEKVKNTTKQNIQPLQENLEAASPKKIALTLIDGVAFYELDKIIYLKAEGSYTTFFLENGQKIMVSKRLAEFERLEAISSYLRIHRSHIINYNKISKILKHAGGSVVMENEHELSISSDKKAILMEKFEESRF